MSILKKKTTQALRRMLLILNSASGRVRLFWKPFLGMKYKVTGDSQQGFIKENHTWPLDHFLLWNVWLCEWGKSRTGVQKTFNTISDSILSWNEERWIIWSNYNVAEKLAIHLTKRKNCCKPSWSLESHPSGTDIALLMFISVCLYSALWYLHQWPRRPYRWTSRCSAKGNAFSGKCFLWQK